ncbi:MAG: T9SS type A sorting domain-containing protein [Saprospiraceae bacterium]|nr:T9SS type A sorting domain-containing protein [Saprospiraceae bacterium]
MKLFIPHTFSTHKTYRLKLDLSKARSFFWVFICILFAALSGKAQDGFFFSYFSNSGSQYSISGLPNPVCDIYVANTTCNWTNNDNPCEGANLQASISNFLDATEPTRFLKATAGQAYEVRLGISDNPGWSVNMPPGGVSPVYVTSDGGATFESGQAWAFNTSNNQNDHIYDVTIRFPRGTTRGAIVMEVREDLDGNPGQYVMHNIIIPVYVVGPVNPNEETPILGTTLDPQIPYMIVHDPPGDGSNASFQDNKTTCRSRETQYARDESNSIHGSAKLGVKGSIGLISSIDYEFYVEFKGSANVGDVSILATTDQVCVSTGVGFATSDLPGAEGGGDVFIGFGRELYYGVYDVIDVRDCGEAFMDRRLVYAPVAGSDRKFVYTTDAILSQIETLKLFRDDTTQNDRVRNQSQNQIDVWEQVLALNEANKNNPDNDTLDLLTYSAGNTQTHSSSIDIVNTSSITTEHYVEGTFGLDVVLNFAGSGFGLGYEYATSERFGATENESGESSQVLDYTLTDDDGGDIFSVDIVRDPMFGTPVFRLNQGSKTSCPYEGGYRRDQPVLTIANTTDTEYYTDGNPDGSVATFKVDLCNESNEQRQYFLKLNAQSNLNGAEVRAAGVPLNGNDLGQEFNIDPLDCVEDLIITVRQEMGSPELSFPYLEIFLYSECDPDVSSSIFADVYFGNATSTKDMQVDDSILSVFPNPATDKLNIQLADNHLMNGYLFRDMTGKVITQYEMSNPVQQTELNLGSLSPGMYLLQVQSDQQILSKKIVIQ